MGRAVFSYDTVAAWDAAVLETFIAHDLLQPTAAAQSVECRGCEERCFSDVVVQPSKAGAVRAYVVCVKCRPSGRRWGGLQCSLNA